LFNVAAAVIGWIVAIVAIVAAVIVVVWFVKNADKF